MATSVIAPVAVWLITASSGMSVETFCWASTMVMALGTVVVKTVQSGAPTRSIVHVLYDTEQQAGRIR